MNDKVFTVQTVDGPAVVQAKIIGKLAIHPSVAKAGPNLGWWTVSLPCGVAMGHYRTHEYATAAAEFLTELNIDWTLSLQELYDICVAKGVFDSLAATFGARGGHNPIHLNGK